MRLHRDVALKVLPDSYAADPGRLARFRREAEILASLNHPHIAGIHGVEESGGTRALVLELVDGETLAERIARGPIPSGEAASIAAQIADALDAAHERGIVHRDLKPANIKVAPDGIVKLLDFGLAKLAPEREPGEDLRARPQSTPMGPSATLPGVLLGTAAYMAPEQVRGRSIDRRADVWAFGAVLYEMVTGRSPFARDTVHDTLGAVLEDGPDWSALAGDIPPRLRRVLELCLEKDPRRRLRDMATARMLMEGAFETAATPEPRLPNVRQAPRWTRFLPWAVATAMGLLAALFAAWSVPPIVPQPVARLTIPVNFRERLDPAAPAVSPDGRYLAYVWGRAGARTLSLHAMADPDGAPLAELAGASYPFFSPDSAWLGFFADGELKKVPAGGGPPQTVARAPGGRGASWGDNGRIVFAPSFRSGLMQVTPEGGEPEPLTSPDPRLDESSHRLPHVLPGARAVIFTALRTRDTAIVAMSLETGERRILIDGVQYARYVPTGHLLYVQAGRLMVVPFDPGRLAIVGSPAPLFSTGVTGVVPTFAVTDTGHLVYRTGANVASTMVWVDRTGTVSPLGRQLQNFVHPRLAPDGGRIVAARNADLWVYDLVRDTLSQLTFEGGNLPLWTPDGRRVIYGRPKTGTGWDIFWRQADGSGSEEGLVTRTLDQSPSGGNPTADGRLLAFRETRPDTAGDIWILSMTDGSERVFLNGPANERSPSFSPDARFLAYVSNELGRDEVFIRPLTGTGGVRRVSYDGGLEPYWAPNGDLFFRSGGGMFVVDVTREPSLAVSLPRRLFDDRYALSSIEDRNYDVTPDGQRFLMVRQDDPAEDTVRLNIAVNWLQELAQRVP